MCPKVVLADSLLLETMDIGIAFAEATLDKLRGKISDTKEHGTENDKLPRFTTDSRYGSWAELVPKFIVSFVVCSCLYLILGSTVFIHITYTFIFRLEFKITAHY